MAKDRKLEAGALNITIHPTHSPERYVELFEKALELRLEGHIRGDSYGSIILFGSAPQGDPNALREGTICRYTKINADASWFNTESRETINPEEDGQIISSSLCPNSKQIYFVFSPQKHRFIFDTREISPRDMRALLINIFADPRLVNEFNEINVHTEVSREAIETILNIPRKTKIEIQIALPNPDEGGTQAEELYMQKMQERRAGRVGIMYTENATKQGLVVDEDMQIEIKVAASNGHVIATGRDEEDHKVEENTKDHPLKKIGWYNPETTNKREFLKTLALKALDAIFD